VADKLLVVGTALVAAAAAQLAYLNWVSVPIVLLPGPPVMMVPLPVVLAAVAAAATCAAVALVYHSLSQAWSDVRRLQGEVVTLRDERRRILALCEAIELPIPFAAILENNVGRPGPLPLGQFAPRVRGEVRAA
jgi:hypothetical protein